MSDARRFIDCEVLTDIHTPSNLAEVEIYSLVEEKAPLYRLRSPSETKTFLEIPPIDRTYFQKFTVQQIRHCFDFYSTSIDRMKRTSKDIRTVTRLLEDRETDLQIAVTLGQNLLQTNESLREQVTLLEDEIERTTELVKQLKHDLLIKERLIRCYTDTDLESISPDEDHLQNHHYETRIRHLEFENRELRAETLQLKFESETFEQQEQALVDHFAQSLANANNDLEQLHDELMKKTEENSKEKDEVVRLTHEMTEIQRRLNELKRENDELKHLLALTGKTRHEYETKIDDLEKNYDECLAKLRQSQDEIQSLEELILDNADSQRETVYLSPLDYANYMSLENSLQSELEEICEDPKQLARRTRSFRRRTETDGDSSINDSAFSDSESLSSASSCQTCQRSSPIPIAEPTTNNDRKISSRLRLVKRLEGSNMLKRWQELAEPSFSSCLQTIPGVYTRAEILQGVKEENEDDLSSSDHESEGKFDLDRMSFNSEKQSPETAKPPATSSGRINLVELLNRHGLTARTFEKSKEINDFEKTFLTSPLPARLRRASLISAMTDETDGTLDDFDDEPGTPPSSPIHQTDLQTGALLQQVLQRLVSLSRRTFENFATSLPSSTEEESLHRSKKIVTPPSSPTFDGLTAPTPNTTARAMKSSTFLRVSSLNPFANPSIRKTLANQRSPGEISSFVDEILRGHLLPRI